MLLLDLAMPEMDGFQLLSIMKADEKLKDIPVIIMSANENTNIVSHCLGKTSPTNIEEMGATDYLVKPVRIQEIRALSTKIRPK